MKGNIRSREKTKLTSFPTDHTSMALLYIYTFMQLSQFCFFAFGQKFARIPFSSFFGIVFFFFLPAPPFAAENWQCCQVRTRQSSLSEHVLKITPRAEDHATCWRSRHVQCSRSVVFGALAKTASLYPGRDTFEVDQWHVTKSQPITVVVLLSQSLGIYKFYLFF